VGEIPLDFYILMFPRKDFLMGLIRKIQKRKEVRDRSGKFRKTRRKDWRKEKEEILTCLEVPILVCYLSMGNTFWLPPSCEPPSGEPTHMGTSPTTLLMSVIFSSSICCEGRVL
jgi:hypothetical protein